MAKSIDLPPQLWYIRIYLALNILKEFVMDFGEFITSEVREFLNMHREYLQLKDTGEIFEHWNDFVDTRSYIVFPDYGFSFLMEKVEGFSIQFSNYIKNNNIPSDALKTPSQVSYFVVYDAGCQLIEKIYSKNNLLGFLRTEKID